MRRVRQSDRTKLRRTGFRAAQSACRKSSEKHLPVKNPAQVFFQSKYSVEVWVIQNIELTDKLLRINVEGFYERTVDKKAYPIF